MTKITVDHTKINPLARLHYGPKREVEMIHEGVAFLSAAQREKREISDNMIVDWKACRGIFSSKEMANPKLREQFIKYARALLSTLT